LRAGIRYVPATRKLDGNPLADQTIDNNTVATFAVGT